jgi:hypothetical protein
MKSSEVALPADDAAVIGSGWIVLAAAVVPTAWRA